MKTEKNADLILSGGIVHTMDAACSTATAVAVRGKKIVAVGTDAAMRALATPGARTIDLAGNTLLPGLIDSHIHLPFIGSQSEQALLYDAKSIAEIIERLRVLAARTTGAIIGVGGNFHELALAEGRLPMAQDLDLVAGDRPVMITDVNKTIVNSLVLNTINVADVPPAGVVPRNAAGKPLGIFLYTAKSMTPTGIQGNELLDPGTLEKAIIRGADAAALAGFTGAVDAWLDMATVAAFRRVERERGLPLRVTLMPTHAEPMNMTPPDLEKARLHYGLTEGRLRFGPIKLLFDYFIMHRTALMYRPYVGQPDNSGGSSISADELLRRIDGAFAANWPVGIHTTGDRGIDLAVQALAEAIQRAGGAPGPCHLIHAYFPTDAALDILARHRIAVAAQPPFIRIWGDSVAEYVGVERARRFTPLRTMLQRGVIVGGGSDSPVVWHTPWVGIHAAITRQTQGGRVLGPDEGITAEQALRCYTSDAAAVTGEEKLRGSIEPGKLADFTLIDRDVLSIAPELIPNTKVLATIVGGEIAYREGLTAQMGL